MSSASEVTKKSAGWSSKVAGWLVIGDQRFPIASVGPDFCILREAAFAVEATTAELIIEVDGDRQTTPVFLLGGVMQGERLVAFVKR